MPSYIENALKRFQHPPPIVLQDLLHPHLKKTYGTKVQNANLPDNSPPLDKAEIKFIQEVMGVFLYLAQAVDLTMLSPLSTLASEQAAPTEKNDSKMPSIFRLCSISRRRNSHLPGEQYGAGDT
jgi:hypothetical protein